MARPRRAYPVDTPKAIREAAWKQIAEQGAPALSLRAIARDLKITAPAIYNYYPDRNHLVTALIVEAFASFAEALEAARDALPADDYMGRFRAISVAYRHWALTYPQRYALIFGTPIPGYVMEVETRAVAERSFRVLASVIDDAYRAGKMHLAPDYVVLTPALRSRYEALIANGLPYSPIVTQLALASWSWIHGLTSLELYGYFTDFLGDQSEEFLRIEDVQFKRNLGME